MSETKSVREFRTIRTPVSVDAEKRQVTGYFARFDERSVVLSNGMKDFQEVIAPGAFTRSLEGSDDILALVDHDPQKLIGRTTSGTLKVWEDERGLAFSVDLPETSYASDLRSLMERGDVSQCSFGFIPRSISWGKADDGMLIRTLKDVELFEGSIVSTPAYPSTSAQLRSFFPEGAPDIPEEFRTEDAPASPAEDAEQHANYMAMQLALLERKH